MAAACRAALLRAPLLCDLTNPRMRHLSCPVFLMSSRRSFTDGGGLHEEVLEQVDVAGGYAPAGRGFEEKDHQGSPATVGKRLVALVQLVVGEAFLAETLRGPAHAHRRGPAAGPHGRHVAPALLPDGRCALKEASASARPTTRADLPSYTGTLYGPATTNSVIPASPTGRPKGEKPHPSFVPPLVPRAGTAGPGYGFRRARGCAASYTRARCWKSRWV